MASVSGSSSGYENYSLGRRSADSYSVSNFIAAITDRSLDVCVCVCLDFGCVCVGGGEGGKIQFNTDRAGMVFVMKFLFYVKVIFIV